MPFSTFFFVLQSKKTILRDVFDNVKGRSLPSGIVNFSKRDVHWFTDEAAAALVQPKQEL